LQYAFRPFMVILPTGLDLSRFRRAVNEKPHCVENGEHDEIQLSVRLKNK